MLPSIENGKNVLAGLEQRISEAQAACTAFISSLQVDPGGLVSRLPSGQELLKGALESTIALSDYYRKNHSLLAESLSGNVEQLVGKTKEIWVQIGAAQRLIGIDAITNEQREQAWDAAQNILFKEMPALYEQIRSQIQEAVGASGPPESDAC
ncbi:MAG: hypothetical protein M1482_16550 [Chloroflexi bacterium]|nr:hypothetical protein [Chloroflexota bacterium]